MKILFVLLPLLLTNISSLFGQKGFIKYDKRSGYFYQNGSKEKSWIPIELNCMLRDSINADTSVVFKKYELFFKIFSSNGGSSVRLWMGREGFFDPTRYEGNTINNDGINHFIKIVSLAKKYNLKLKVCLEVARNFSGKGAFHKDKLAKNEGGNLLRFSEYLDKDIGRSDYLKKVKLFSSFFKNNSTIYCWELWNEINTVSEGDWKSFSIYMINELRKYFPNHLISVSLGSLDSKWQLNCYKSYLAIDNRAISFVHRYFDLGAEMDICKADIDLFLSDAVNTIASLQISKKPIFVNETGAVEPKHSGDSKLYALDTAGVLLHDMIFTPFFCGAVGPGSMWHYWSYIQPNNLWYHYARFKNVIVDITTRKKLIPFKLEGDGVRLWGLKGKKDIIIWCKNVNSNIKTELLDKSKIKATHVQSISLKNMGIKKYLKSGNFTIYNPWSNSSYNNLIIDNNIIIPSFTRTIVIKIKI